MSDQLTVMAIEKMQPGASRREIPDGKQRGLHLIVQTTGAKSWGVRYRDVTGRTRKLTLGSWPSVDLAQARKLASKAISAVADGRDPAAEKQKARREAVRAEEDSFEALAERFLRERAMEKNRSRTVREYARQLGFRLGEDGALTKSHGGIIIEWRGRRASEIKRADVKKLIGAIRARGAGVLANRTLATLSIIFGWAVKEEIIKENPCFGIERPSSEETRDRVLADEELVRIWKACDALGYPFGDSIKLMILTGQRRGEVAGMQWRELDLDAGTWSMPKERTKNGRSHIVPLPASAVELLQKVPRLPGDFVFTVDGAGPASAFAHAKERLDDAIDPALEPWTFHDLRRSLATGLQRLGIRLEVTEAVLNHVSGSRSGVAGIYQRHDWASEKRAALEAWSNHVLKIVNGSVTSNVFQMRAY
jgi:integrase